MSSKPYFGLPYLEYPLHEFRIPRHRLWTHRENINISTVLAGQKPGLKEVGDDIWLVSLMHDDLGYIDLEQKILQSH